MGSEAEEPGTPLIGRPTPFPPDLLAPPSGAQVTDDGENVAVQLPTPTATTTNQQRPPRGGASTRRTFASTLPEAWAHLDRVDLSEELLVHVATMEDVPWSIRNDFRRTQAATFQSLVDAYQQSADGAAVARERG